MEAEVWMTHGVHTALCFPDRLPAGLSGRPSSQRGASHSNSFQMFSPIRDEWCRFQHPPTPSMSDHRGQTGGIKAERHKALKPEVKKGKESKMQTKWTYFPFNISPLRWWDEDMLVHANESSHYSLLSFINDTKLCLNPLGLFSLTVPLWFYYHSLSDSFLFPPFPPG